MIIVYYHPFNTPLDPQVCGSAWPAGLGTSAAVRVELPACDSCGTRRNGDVTPRNMGIFGALKWGCH